MNKVREGYKEYEFGVIPNDWQVKKLGDIFNDLKGGSTPSRLIDRYYTGDIPWITSGELKYKTIYNTLESITEEAVKDTNLKLYPEGTFFIAITGLEVEGTRGSCDITGVPATTNQSCLAFQPKEGFSNLYLYHWYRLYGNYIGLKYTQGTKQQSLNNKIVGKLEIPVPKLEEQEKIASILSTVDEQIDNVDALIEKNKELKKGLMQTLLTKGIGHTKFKKTEIGEIPEEWDVKKLECVFEILDSMRKPIKASDREKIEGNIPYYGASGVIDWINDYIFDEELILLGEDGENLNSRNSDLAFKISGKTWVNNHAHVFRVINKKECNIDFMVYYLEAKDYSIYIAGSAQPKITQAQCRKFLLPLPEKQEQDKIASILLESDEKIEEYENKKKKLEELKKGLMQKLLTGSIRVF
mgnify:CR=1 FL=1